MEDKDVRWITVNGNHIPIKKGQTVKEAIENRFEKAITPDDKSRELFIKQMNDKSILEEIEKNPPPIFEIIGRAKNEVIIFEAQKDFEDQVDSVLSGADTASSHLRVLKETPIPLQEVGFSNKPILMTAKHLHTIVNAGPKSGHYHDLGIQRVKNLPEKIADPLLIMDSLTQPDSVVLVTDMLDNNMNPVVVAIKADGKGYINKIEIEANIMASAYGKSGFHNFMTRNIQQNTLLYINKEKSQTIKIPGLQLPNNLKSPNSTNIIRKASAFVNKNQQIT